MSISFYKINKWINMMRGKSVHHVNQNEGLAYSKTGIKGYYNNLTEKVTRFAFPGDSVPKSYIDSGKEIYFSIEIFQYGLASYDLFLLNNDDLMRRRVIACANWALDNQLDNGAWVTFEEKHPNNSYSAMAQGEGISLLLRAYMITNDERFLCSAKKAKEFMVLPISEGGTTDYENNHIVFMEYPTEPVVLNGWIFSWWGLYDYVKFFDDDDTKKLINASLNSLVDYLPKFDNGYWTKYDSNVRIASPFYHKLHIAQLKVMYNLTDREIFNTYACRWEQYQHSGLNRKKAFVNKVIQKLMEK